MAVHFITSRLKSEGDLSLSWEASSTNLKEHLESQFVAIIYRSQPNSNKFRISIQKLGNLYKQLYLSPSTEDHLFDLS